MANDGDADAESQIKDKNITIPSNGDRRETGPSANKRCCNQQPPDMADDKEHSIEAVEALVRAETFSKAERNSGFLAAMGRITVYVQLGLDWAYGTAEYSDNKRCSNNNTEEKN